MSTEETLSQTLDALFAAQNRSDAPGLVVGVAQHGKLLYRRAYGMASLELGVANTPMTRMRIGSTTKHFACLAAFLLAEEGKLDLDAPASAVLPEFPSSLPMPTLRQFMQHTSGIRDYLDLFTTAAGLAVQPPGMALATQLRQGANNFAPGDKQIYCNGGYHLLSLAIERASGQSLAAFLRERVFTPLGMVNTELVLSDCSVTPGMAGLYVPQIGGWRRGIFVTEEILGEGGIVSTVDDMLRWLSHLRQPNVVGSAESWRQLQQVAVLNNGLVTTYACGLWRHDYRGVEIVYHSGNVYGGACQMLSVPAHGLDIIIMTNGALVAPTLLAKAIVDAVLPQALNEVRPRLVDSKGFEHLFGLRYASASGLVIGFDDAGGKLGISFQGSPAAPVLRDDAERLFVGFEDLAMGPFAFHKADLAAVQGGAPTQLRWTECGLPEDFALLPKVAPDTAHAAAELLGRYTSADLTADAEMVLQDGRLILRWKSSYGCRQWQLTPLSDAVFTAIAIDPLMPDRTAITVLRDAGRVTGFHLSTGRTRRLQFDRLP